MPKRSNRRKNVSSKNILKKMKDLSEYYKKKILKGGEGGKDDATRVAELAKEGADKSSNVATEQGQSNAAGVSRFTFSNPFSTPDIGANSGSGSEVASGAPGASGTSSVSLNRVDKAASGAAPAGAQKPWYQFWGGKSNKRRRNRNRKQTNKKRN
jgi:hypothetical protein